VTAQLAARDARTLWWSRAVRDGLSVVGAGMLVVLLVAAPGVDSHAYWAFNGASPYGPADALGRPDAFLYAPPAALFFLPFHLLPWPAFRVLWLLVDVAALAVLSRRWTLAMVAVYPVVLELSAGNINLLLAIISVWGIRYPGIWSVALLTKVTPGVGLLWFVVRREWRSLAIALAWTCVIAAASFVVVPAWWPQWVATLLGSAGVAGPASSAPLVLRLLLASAVVAWGAHTDRTWTIPVAVTISLPALWVAGLSVLTAGLVLARQDTRHQTLMRVLR
jgi:Glycosyltransferase family 87